MPDALTRAIGPDVPFVLGSWRVDPRKNVMEDCRRRVHVEHKAMRVLTYLAQHTG